MNATKPARVAALLSLFLLACGPAALEGAMPCESEAPPAACGTACTEAGGCETGFYCSSGACTADCRHQAREQGCPSGEVCNAEGQCQAP